MGAGGALNAALAIIAWTAVGAGLLGASYGFLLLMSQRFERRRPEPARYDSPWGDVVSLPLESRPVRRNSGRGRSGEQRGRAVTDQGSHSHDKTVDNS
jgi:hypothetical protein